MNWNVILRYAAGVCADERRGVLSLLSRRDDTNPISTLRAFIVLNGRQVTITVRRHHPLLAADGHRFFWTVIAVAAR